MKRKKLKRSLRRKIRRRKPRESVVNKIQEGKCNKKGAIKWSCSNTSHQMRTEALATCVSNVKVIGNHDRPSFGGKVEGKDQMVWFHDKMRDEVMKGILLPKGKKQQHGS